MTPCPECSGRKEARLEAGIAAILRAVSRKLNPHFCSGTDSRRNEYLRLVLLRDPFRDRKPKPRSLRRASSPAVRPRPRRIASIESLEDSRQLVGTYPDPAVRHYDRG